MLPFPLRENAGSFEQDVLGPNSGSASLSPGTRTNLFTYTNVYTTQYPDIMAGVVIEIKSSVAPINATLYLNVNGTDVQSLTFGFSSSGTYYYLALTGQTSLPAGSQLTVKVDAVVPSSGSSTTLSWESTFVALATIIVSAQGASSGVAIANLTFAFTTALRNEIDKVLVVANAIMSAPSGTYSVGLNLRSQQGAIVAALTGSIHQNTPTTLSLFATAPAVGFMPVPPDRTSTYSVNTADGLTNKNAMLLAISAIVVEEASVIVA